jgi:hypothetical protein
VIFEAILGVLGVLGVNRANSRNSPESPIFAPMGVQIDDFINGDSVVLRPFFSSRTGQALLSSGAGALNFADDALLFARTALTDETPPSRGPVLCGVPFWWDVSVVSSERDDVASRWTISCRVDRKNFTRSFLPFNRAGNAVLEAAILATRSRLHSFDRARAMERIGELEAIAIKTGGERELHAFKIVRASIE